MQECFDEPLDLTDPAAASALVLQRSTALQTNNAITYKNLAIAQQRDRLHYAKMRSGAMVPQVRNFQIGDYDYVKSHQEKAFQTQAKDLILRELHISELCILTLMDKVGTLVKEHPQHCAPCHLAIARNLQEEALLRWKSRPANVSKGDLAC